MIHDILHRELKTFVEYLDMLNILILSFAKFISELVKKNLSKTQECRTSEIYRRQLNRESGWETASVPFGGDFSKVSSGIGN